MESLRARCAVPHEQELLQVPGSTPPMYMERLSYAASGQGVDGTHSFPGRPFSLKDRDRVY